MKAYVYGFLIVVLVSGCKVKQSPILMSPPELPPEAQRVEVVSDSSEGLKVNFNAKVDILFVVDNSRSMENEITTVQKNIESFAKSLAENLVMDYHIGVTTVYDSIRYTDSIDQVLKLHPVTGDVQFLEKGELRPLRDSKGSFLWDKPRYVHRGNAQKSVVVKEKLRRQDGSAILDSLGKAQFNDVQRTQLEALFTMDSHFDTRFVDDNIIEDSGEFTKVAFGPAYEESFSPILSSFDASSSYVKGTNMGFYRKEAHLVVFILSDAEDSTPAKGVGSKDGLMNPKDLYAAVLKFKKDPSKISAVGLLCPKYKSGQCRRVNPNLQGSQVREKVSQRIREFVNVVQKNQNQDIHRSSSPVKAFLPLNSPHWGEDLAKLGTDIKKRVLQKSIKLKDLPEFDKETGQILISVKYGDIQLDENDKTGWTYNATTNSVTIHSGVSPDVLDRQDPVISINYVKVDPNMPYSKKL